MLIRAFRRSPKLLRWSALLAAGLLVLYLALVAIYEPNAVARLWVGNIIIVVTGLLAAAALVYAARTAGLHQPQLLQAWTLLALAQLFTTLGDSVWAMAELSGQPIPTLADALYLAYYPLFVVAVLLLPSVIITRAERVRLLL